MSKLIPIFNRLFGVKPGPEAPKLERLLWFRRYYVRNLVLVVPVAALWLLFLPPWLLLIPMLPWLLGFARVDAEIRATRKHDNAP